MYNTIWLVNISLYIFLISSHCEFSNRKISCVRKELTDVVSSLQKQLQQINLQGHLFGEFAIAPLTFLLCTYTTDTFPFTYHFPYIAIPISQPLNCSPICTVDNFQHFKLQIDFLDNPLQRRGSHFWFPYTLQSSGNLLWRRETEAHILLLLFCSLHVSQKKVQGKMKTQTVLDVSIEAII